MLGEGLLQSAAPVRARIRAAGNDQGHRVETYLDISARHVVASRLGAGLYAEPTIVGILADPGSVETAALVLVFGSGQASMDLCATSLLRWNGIEPPKNKEFDVGELSTKIKKGLIGLSPPQRAWFDQVVDSPRGKQFGKFRAASIHRLVRQDVTVGGLPRQTISHDPGSPGDKEAAELLDDHASFVEERWREFWNVFL